MDNTNKNKGTQFNDYLKLVVAELCIAGYNREEDYPDEDDVMEDWKKGITPRESANSFIESWKSIGIEPVGATPKEPAIVMVVETEDTIINLEEEEEENNELDI